MLPLRDVANGESGEEIIQVHVPFSMSDLVLCKEKLGQFSKGTSKATEGFNHLTVSYDLTWSDLQIVLSYCCMEMESITQEELPELKLTN